MRDTITGGLVTLDIDHHMVHNGEVFSIDDSVSLATGTQLWLITTPDSTEYAHMVFGADCTGEMIFIVTEGADRTTGTTLTPINRRRVGTPKSATVTVKRGATNGSTNGTTTIKSTRVGATGKFSVVGGEDRGMHEYILKPNTKYVVSATTIATTVVTLRLNWYEHTDKVLPGA